MARDLSRFLQPPTPRERAALAVVPARIGPVEFEQFGAKWVRSAARPRSMS